MSADELLAAAPRRRGEVINDNYVLGDAIGVGGVGIVYSATQRSLDRAVAIKVPRPELTNVPLVLTQFRTEALAASRIDHRNVVRVLDYGVDHAVPYVVMENVSGWRLSRMLAQQGPLSLSTTIRIVRELVAGLEEVHHRGVIHADVKCDNVLIEPHRDGTAIPRLIDFGIARLLGSPPPSPTAERQITGTPEYLAPEVIRGEEPGIPADIHAVGVMLYELVTGNTPFGGGTTTQVMSRRLDEDVIPLSLRCTDRVIPSAFERLVLRALARDPAARFESATALGRALDDVAATMSTGRGRRETPPPPIPAPIFSTEATTENLTAEGTPPRGSQLETPSAAQRHEIHAAISSRQPDRIVVAYLTLARHPDRRAPPLRRDPRARSRHHRPHAPLLERSALAPPALARRSLRRRRRKPARPHDRHQSSRRRTPLRLLHRHRTRRPAPLPSRTSIALRTSAAQVVRSADKLT